MTTTRYYSDSTGLSHHKQIQKHSQHLLLVLTVCANELLVHCNCTLIAHTHSTHSLAVDPRSQTCHIHPCAGQSWSSINC